MRVCFGMCRLVFGGAGGGASLTSWLLARGRRLRRGRAGSATARAAFANASALGRVGGVIAPFSTGALLVKLASLNVQQHGYSSALNEHAGAQLARRDDLKAWAPA